MSTTRTHQSNEMKANIKFKARLLKIAAEVVLSMGRPDDQGNVIVPGISMAKLQEAVDEANEAIHEHDAFLGAWRKEILEGEQVL